MSDDLRERVALLPCPFCGGRGIDNASAPSPYVYCESCDANGSERDTWNEAVAAWNTRADAALAAIEPAPISVREAARVLLDEWMTAKIPSATMTLFLKGQPRAALRAIAEGKDDE